MALTDIERNYLAARRLGRLATVAPDGTPQNKPVGFHYDSELGTIDIYGFGMETSAKFHNIQVNPDVAFVVDDVVGEGASGTRFLEVRGRAEVASRPTSSAHLSESIIRIHPRRVIGWNIDPNAPGLYTRDVLPGDRHATTEDRR